MPGRIVLCTCSKRTAGDQPLTFIEGDHPAGRAGIPGGGASSADGQDRGGVRGAGPAGMGGREAGAGRQSPARRRPTICRRCARTSFLRRRDRRRTPRAEAVTCCDPRRLRAAGKLGAQKTSGRVHPAGRRSTSSEAERQARHYSYRPGDVSVFPAERQRLHQGRPASMVTDPASRAGRAGGPVFRLPAPRRSGWRGSDKIRFIGRVEAKGGGKTYRNGLEGDRRRDSPKREPTSAWTAASHQRPTPGCSGMAMSRRPSGRRAARPGGRSWPCHRSRWPATNQERFTCRPRGQSNGCGFYTDDKAAVRRQCRRQRAASWRHSTCLRSRNPAPTGGAASRASSTATGAVTIPAA